MSQKIKNVSKSLHAEGIDSLLVTNQSNVSYLTNFTGLSPNEREGFFLITKKDSYLITFPTYYGLFRKGGDGFASLCITHNMRLSHHLNNLIGKHQLKSLGFEKNNLTVAELATLRSKLKIKLVETEAIVEKDRLIKENDEIEKIRKSARVTDKAFKFILTTIKRGLSEKDIALEIEYFIKKNADGISFNPIVAFNEHAAIPHYIPSSNQKLKNNSLLLLDFGAKASGYCSDMTRVIFYGKPQSQWLNIYNTVLKAQEKALNYAKVGRTGNDIDGIARNYITNAGYPEYPHGLGHGVGLDIHEDPRLKKESHDVLKENMVVTIEPGIYIEGNCGVRIEDLLVIKEKDNEILSQSPKEIITL